MENTDKILNICPLESMTVNISRIFEEKSFKYCTEIAELRYKNILLKEEFDILAAANKKLEVNLDLKEKTINKLLKSISSLEEKHHFCLNNNSELSDKLSFQNKVIEELKGQIESLISGNKKIADQCARQEKLIEISSSEETIKLKTDVEELKKIIGNLNEKLKGSRDDRMNQAGVCKENILEITINELQKGYQELLKENKELKKTLC